MYVRSQFAASRRLLLRGQSQQSLCHDWGSRGRMLRSEARNHHTDDDSWAFRVGHEEQCGIRGLVCVQGPAAKFNPRGWADLVEPASISTTVCLVKC